MKKLLKYIFLYPLSLFIWLFWWMNAFVSIILLIVISLFIPKKFYNFFVRITCTILTYSAFLFPKVKGLKRSDLPYPVIYSANHTSFFDLFICGATLPGNPRGIELKEHFTKPIYGWFISRFGQIPIEIGKRASVKESFYHAIDILKNRVRNILLMPEGHRTQDGSLREFRSGAFYLSIKSGAPVVPVVFKRLYDRNNKNSILIRPRSFDVVIMEPVYPDKFANDHEMASFVRNLMIKEIQN
jgi:1-acyl-sn-glycerol-3-phosphate acyltransferase